MKKTSNSEDYEKAAKIRDQLRALEKVLAHAKIFEPQPFQKIDWPQIQKTLQQILKTNKVISRIEAYDVSNIQGEAATGSLVTFVRGLPDKNFYRKFKIKNRASAGSEGEDEDEVLIASQGKPNDIAMVKEVLKRRLKHLEWGLPDLILIDGGKAQLNVAVKSKSQKPKTRKIKVLAIAKKKNELFIEGQKKPILLKTLPREIFNLILELRDEAHRFAISYHRKLREIDLRPQN
jgi:excinuclease ABC subunit C